MADDFEYISRARLEYRDERAMRQPPPGGCAWRSDPKA